MPIFTEDTYEQALIALLQDLGYRYQYGPDIERDYSDPLLDDVLQASLQRINPSLPPRAIDDAIKKLHQIEGSSLYESKRFEGNHVTFDRFNPITTNN